MFPCKRFAYLLLRSFVNKKMITANRAVPTKIAKKKIPIAEIIA
jgi:hypothetical protein